MIEINELCKIDYFRSVAPANANLQELARLTQLAEYERDQILFLEDEPGTELYYLIKGQVRLYKSGTGGREQVLQIIRAEQSFNEIALLDGGIEPVTAQAMEVCRVWKMPGTSVLALLQHEPSVGAVFANRLANRLRTMSELVGDLSLRQVTARVAKILLEQAEQPSISGIGIASEVTAQLTQEQMAALVGTVREVIGRALRQLQRTGAIEPRRGHIIIKDTNRLKTFL